MITPQSHGALYECFGEKDAMYRGDAGDALHEGMGKKGVSLAAFGNEDRYSRMIRISEHRSTSER